MPAFTSRTAVGCCTAGRRSVWTRRQRRWSWTTAQSCPTIRSASPPVPRPSCRRWRAETVEKTFTFMTLDDALALEAAVKDDSRVLIVGAGLIGLKCAEGFITAPPPSPSAIWPAGCCPACWTTNAPRGCSGIWSARHPLSARRQRAPSGRQKAYMNGGAVVDFDVLVLAVGVRANTALVRDAGGETNRGILVDESMRTSLPDVYAAGDCTEGEDVSLGGGACWRFCPTHICRALRRRMYGGRPRDV
ncbi:MAG: FAD-dependent oxidoreductase [Acutalibacteraceae bacterium]